MSTILGIHHVTAISGDAQETMDFYAGVLGLRLVKKTVNFDDPGTYHLYFGNEQGQPGTIMTFFPWGSRGLQGKIGTGQVSTTSFSIPADSVGFWSDRLRAHDVQFDGPESRFDEEVLRLRDRDGLQLELVATTNDDRPAWEKGPIAPEFAIRGFYHVSLSVERYERTAGLLTATLGFRTQTESGSRFRFVAGDGSPGAIVDVLCRPDDQPGRMGVGTVHHVAWRTPSEESQLNIRRKVAGLDYNVTPVLDRNYFKSIYFREPGYVLFEVATDPPGFTIDEPIDGLGSTLTLPPWLEKQRADIEETLPSLSAPPSEQKKTS